MNDSIYGFRFVKFKFHFTKPHWKKIERKETPVKSKKMSSTLDIGYWDEANRVVRRRGGGTDWTATLTGMQFAAGPMRNCFCPLCHFIIFDTSHGHGIAGMLLD